MKITEPSIDAKMGSPTSVKMDDEDENKKTESTDSSKVDYSYNSPTSKKKPIIKEFGSINTPNGRRSARIATKKR